MLQAKCWPCGEHCNYCFRSGLAVAASAHHHVSQIRGALNVKRGAFEDPPAVDTIPLDQ